MVEILQDPQLRYTADNQMPIAEMMVQFSGPRPTDAPGSLKVIGWGNLAQEISANYHQGDQVIIEGRLGMSLVERPEGFKEKRAELTVQKIYGLGAGAFSASDSLFSGSSNPEMVNSDIGSTPMLGTSPSNVVPLNSRNRPPSESPPITQPSPAAQPLTSGYDEPDDPIPF